VGHLNVAHCTSWQALDAYVQGRFAVWAAGWKGVREGFCGA
jgi:hypothetical protein